MGSVPLFTGAAAPLLASTVEATAKYLEVTPLELWTVLAVETRGTGFFADRRPRILFERHKFSRFTRGKFDETHPDVSHPERGGYSYGPAEYARLERALVLDAPAALRATSWGLGQVMGFNWKRVGYQSPADLVRGMLTSEGEQLCAMALYVRSEPGLQEALRTHQWADFACAYNGAEYRDNKYDEKLAEAFESYSSRGLPELDVREGQMLLTYLGYSPGGVDGEFGPKTEAATKRFQGARGLERTGHLDEATLAVLRARHAELPRNEVVPGTTEEARHVR